MRLVKKGSALVLSFLLAAALAGPSAAQQQPPAPQAKPAERPVRPTRVSGEVIAVDPVAKTVTVKTKKKDVVLNVTDKTKIMSAVGKERKEIGLSDLKSGDRITASAAEEEGKMIARAIRVSGPKGGKGGAGSPAEKSPGKQ
jgi:Cu/Ag efflux protein CusF